MIVMKFGGSSVAESERILGIAELVRARLDRRPLVVVSALAGITDILELAIAAAREGQRERLEPLLADLERRHRWALAGCVEHPERRHHLSVEVDGLFDQLRQQLRSIRILAESTPRAADAVLAFGETLSARIVSAAFHECGLRARWIDPREVMVTDPRFGAAEPDVELVRRRAERVLLPRLRDGEVPVLGGFVGATASGETTTLGRGGSDTTAAVLGAALAVEEIQIWTDVDGLMSADPRRVPAARTLPRATFAEAAELAFYGARVLHPASIAPAVRSGIPVRVLNSLRPEGEGTVILDSPGDSAPRPLAALASRAGLTVVQVTNRRMRVDAEFLPRVLEVARLSGWVPDLVLASEVAVGLVFPERVEGALLGEGLGSDAQVETREGRAIICLVGTGLVEKGAARARALAALAEWEPEIVSLGAAATSVTAVVPEAVLDRAVRKLHERFFEQGAET